MASSIRNKFIFHAGLGLAVVLADQSHARVTRLEVEKVAPAAASPGAKAYEIVTGRFYGEVDPAPPANAIITDIASAPRNSRSLVEYSATFAIARPVDARNASVMLRDINR